MSYESAVRSLSDMDAKSSISCTNPENVATLYKVFFDRAESEVKILTDSLSEEVFCRPDVLEALEKAINRSISFKVIIKNKPSENNEFLNTIVRHQEWRTHSLKIYNAFETSKAEGISAIEQNFCIVDKKSYRWSEKEGEGVASMKLPKTARALSELFDTFVDCLVKDMEKV